MAAAKTSTRKPTEKRQRGRPRHADDVQIARQDEMIGRTVEQLMLWGHAQDAVCECIGRIGIDVLGYTASSDRRPPAGKDRVEQIYEAWLKRSGRTAQRWRFSKHWLIQTQRDKTLMLDQQARALLMAGGRLPRLYLRTQITDVYGEYERLESDCMLHGDPELTPRGRRAEAELFAPFRRRPKIG